MRKLCGAGAALEVALLAIYLVIEINVLIYSAIGIAILTGVLYFLTLSKSTKSEYEQSYAYEDIGECNQEYQQLEARLHQMEVEVKELKAQLKEKDEFLHRFALQCHKISGATDAEKVLSGIIVKKTEDATLELTNHVYSIGDWSKDVDNLIQRVFGQLTSDEGGLRVQSVRLEEELHEIEQLIEEFKVIRDDYIGELEMIEKTMHSVDQFTETITDLSEKTNVLAINASIEAARAGNAGRGFAVIASEVQELAKNTMKIADEISTTIDSSVHTIKESISVYGERLQNAVEKLSKSGEQHAAVIEQLTPQIDQVSQVIEESQKLSASVTQNINDVTVHLQYQDSVRQILEHMVQFFDKLTRDGVELSNELVRVDLSEIEQKKNEMQGLLESYFTTREEWEAFGHTIEEDLKEHTEDEAEYDNEKKKEAELRGDITLF